MFPDFNGPHNHFVLYPFMVKSTLSSVPIKTNIMNGKYKMVNII